MYRLVRPSEIDALRRKLQEIRERKRRQQEDLALQRRQPELRRQMEDIRRQIALEEGRPVHY